MKGKKKSKGVFVERHLIESQAFLALKGAASQVLMILMTRRQMAKIGPKGRQKWCCVNNGEITLTYNEAAKKYGLSKKRFRKAIDELVDKGFLDIARLGGGVFREPNLYGLSDRWQSWGMKDFQKAERPKRNYQLGYCKKK